MCSEYLKKEDGIIYKANVDESRSQSGCCASRFIKNLCFDLFSSDFMEHEYEWPLTRGNNTKTKDHESNIKTTFNHLVMES